MREWLHMCRPCRPWSLIDTFLVNTEIIGLFSPFSLFCCWTFYFVIDWLYIRLPFSAPFPIAYQSSPSFSLPLYTYYVSFSPSLCLPLSLYLSECVCRYVSLGLFNIIPNYGQLLLSEYFCIWKSIAVCAQSGNICQIIMSCFGSFIPERMSLSLCWCVVL